MNIQGVRGPRCPSCKDGLIVLITGKGRVETHCHCSRGVERAEAAAAKQAEDKLRARLLAAFYETAK